MRCAKKILINLNAKISDAILLLEKTQEKLLICIDSKKKFAGVLNDGDIRRALIKGAKTNYKIKTYVKNNALTVNEGTNYFDASKILSNNVLILPIINKFEEVVGYYSYEDKLNSLTTTSKEILVVGVGYVGLTLSIVLSSVGFRVYGFDKNKKVILSLKKGETPFYEKGLKKYLDFNNHKNLIFTDNISKISLNRVNTFIVSVGTPIKNNKKATLRSLESSILEISKILKKNDLIILRSTIPVGCTRGNLVPILEKQSKLKVGSDFSIAYAPERTAEGMALEELKLNPQIIGGWDQLSVERTANIFNNITHSIIRVPNIETAELCKLVDNSYRDHLFAFTNQFIPLCKKLNINLTNLVNYVNHGYDRNNIAKPSPGVGGPCLTKDPYILKEVFDKHKIKNKLLVNSRNTNENVINFIYQRISSYINNIKKNKKNIKIFFLGIAFKGHPETSDYRDSTSILLLNKLKKIKKIKEIGIYDPVISKKELKKIDLKFFSINNGFKKADIVIFFNNHKSYLDLDIYKLISKMNKPSYFFDMWGQFDSFEIKKLKGVIYWGLGSE